MSVDPYKGARVRLVIPPVPNPEGGYYSTGDDAAKLIRDTLHNQEVVVGSRITRIFTKGGAEKCDLHYRNAKLVTGPDKNGMVIVAVEWMIPLQVPCICSMQTLMAQGCQDPMHI